MKKYDVKINGKLVNAWAFKWTDVIRLWQAISEEGEPA